LAPVIQVHRPVKLLAAILLASAVFASVARAASAEPVSATVLKVVDGDTVEAQFSADGHTERLRLIGTDAPELVDPQKPVQCFAREALAHAHQLLDGQSVSLDGDPSQDARDRFGRLLVYVTLPDGSLFNQRMIAEGFAHEYTRGVPYQRQADFKAAEQQAHDQGLGFWSATTCNGDTTQAVAPPPTGGDPAEVGSSPEPPATQAQPTAAPTAAPTTAPSPAPANKPR
jgi:micrococcal nuclease